MSTLLCPSRLYILSSIQLGELNAAKVAGELNIPYMLSTAGSQPIEEVARVNGNGPRFFQVSCVANRSNGEEVADAMLSFIALTTRSWKTHY